MKIQSAKSKMGNPIGQMTCFLPQIKMHEKKVGVKGEEIERELDISTKCDVHNLSGFWFK